MKTFLTLFALLVINSLNLIAQWQPNVRLTNDLMGRAPVSDNVINPHIQVSLLPLLSPTSRAFGYYYFSPVQGPAKFYLNTPGTATYLSAQTDFFKGGSWANGKWYAITEDALTLVTCDTITGANIVIGGLVGVPSTVISGLAWDPVNSTMYLFAGAAPSSLYTVNLTTGAATLVTTITGVQSVIDGAFSNGGILYGIEASGSGNFGRINITTGVWTTIGPLGIIPFYAQGCAFDRSDGKLYWAALQQSGVSDFRTIDTSTGVSTVIASLPNGTEIDGLVIPPSSPTTIEPIENAIPTEYSLRQNYPNPFNPSTSIQYAVSSNQFVQLKVYDVLGNEVATLVNEEKPAGNYEASFDASRLSSGVYFYKLKAGSYVETKKMVITK